MFLKALDFAAIACYFLLMLGIGLYFAKRQTSTESYFLGGRTVSWFLAGISIIATLLSTISYVSVPGEMVRYGIGFFSSYLSLFLVLPIVNRIVIPYLMQLPVTSIYEYLERRYSRPVRTLAAIVFVLTRLIWIGLIIYTASFALSAMTGWSMPSIILVLGIITTCYTTLGGMSAVIWSDFVQFLILFGGAFIVPIAVAIRTGDGPIEWWRGFAAAGHMSVPVFSLDPTVRITLVGMILVFFVWNICTYCADQVAAQRYLSTPSIQSARRSVWVAVTANAVLVSLLMICGLALFHFYLGSSNLPPGELHQQLRSRADHLMPEFIARELPAGVSGLFLAALMSAAMSSLSSGINSISTVVVTDLLEHTALRRSHRDGIGLARGIAVGAGILGMSSGLEVNHLMQSSGWNLLELMERANHLFVAPLGALFFAGIAFPRVGTYAAVAGFVAGSLTGVTISFSSQIYALERPISFMWIMPASLLVSMLVSYACGFLFTRSSETGRAGTGRERAQ